MAMKKEPVLAIATLVVAALVGKSYLVDVEPMRGWRPEKAEWKPAPLAAAQLVTTAAAAPVRRDFCTEPSETRPLPPRQLDFPPRAPLSLAALPLDVGPDLRAAYAIRVPGGKLEGAPVAQSGEAAAPAGPAGPAAPEPSATPTRKELEERAARSYDRVWSGNLPNPTFGVIEADPRVDLFALEESGEFAGVQLRLQEFVLSKWKLGDVRPFGTDPSNKIDKIALAGTLRNDIARRERKVPDTIANGPERKKLILWLLDKGKEVGGTLVYDKALAHARRYRELSPSDPEGPRLLQLVLRARGDLAGELAMLESLAATGPEGAFRFEGLGVMKANLGLWADAEADLRQAMAQQPGDPRWPASLAEFLLRRGRTREALDCALAAEQAIEIVQDVADKARIGRVLVACQLAAGDLAHARAVMAFAQATGPQPYLDGCIAYAAGDATAALTAFRGVAGGPDNGAAQYGQAACLCALGKLQEAHDLLLRLYDQEPLLRGRVATGLAWLFLRCGQYESANTWIDRALEAEPQDAFAFYLRGRTLRLSGQLEAAVEALSAALRRRDDFVHAIAEMAEVQGERALAIGGAEQATAAIAASKYADRAVELAPAPSTELYELQGLHAFAAGKAAEARAAFTKARDLVSDDKAKWYGKGALAVVDYSRGLVDDAADVLHRMTQDIPKDDPMAKWAAARSFEIEDHAQKETLGDAFERKELGDLWKGDADGGLGPQIDGGRVVFNGGKFKNGTRVYAERVGVVRRGKNFLAVGVAMHAGKTQPTVDSFYGLAIELPAAGAGSAPQFRVRLGVRDGKPHVWIDDGRDNNGETSFHQDLAVADFQLDKPQQLELRVVPRGDEQSKQFALQVRWNGAVVLARDLRTLSASTSTDLKTLLFVEGRKGDPVDVAFDDYRLERRKEQ